MAAQIEQALVAVAADAELGGAMARRGDAQLRRQPCDQRQVQLDEGRHEAMPSTAVRVEKHCTGRANRARREYAPSACDLIGMCGIAGFTGPSNRAALQSMTQSLRHRGPDSAGFWEGPEVSLGM